jgi:UDP-glucose 4-epimerase
MAARQAKVKRLVYASSSSIYGSNKKYPQTESMRGLPLSPYAVSKYTAELYAAVFAQTYGLETVALRYFNVFGPRQHPDSAYAAVIPKFMKWAVDGVPLEVHGDGKQSRDFTYIDNVVEANLLASTTPGVSGEVFNIACSQSSSLLQIIKELEKFIGHPLKRNHVPSRTGDVRKTWADIRLAKRKLHYAPRVDLRAGLKQTWQWYTSQSSVAAARS